MTSVAGVDGTPGGWAVVTWENGQTGIRKIRALSELIDHTGTFDVIAVDVPIGLLTVYEVGGRVCDRAARAVLGPRRASSVFPAPVRSVLGARTWEDACTYSRTSAAYGKGVSKQTFAIVPKIKEIDELLQQRPELRAVVREVHPEVCFCELTGKPMSQRKSSALGREERRKALVQVFPDLGAIEKTGRAKGIPIEDILDAAVSCWSAQRLAKGRGRSLPATVPFDSTGLPMTIWV
jgi:predicted RNase H-like nuclease